MKVKVIKIISFVLIFCMLFYSVNKILRFKYDTLIYPFDSFYELDKNTIDVLFIGNSHVHYDINPAILYKDYGIVSFNLSSDGAVVWVNYYYLKEVLKTHKPKLIILEAYAIIYSHNYYPYHRMFTHNAGLKWSIDKINSLKISATRDKWNEVFNPLYQYHGRYGSLTISDFLKYKNQYNKYKYYKNYIFLSQKRELGYYNLEYYTNINEQSNLSDKAQNYYLKILELAKKHNIPILVMFSPYHMSKKHIKMANTIKRIAYEYGVPFVNFTFKYNDYNLNFNEDFGDSGHLTYIGATKFTRYLGQYLKENYDLPDRRGDPKYYSWEMNAKYQDKEIYNFELKKSANLNEYIEKVKNVDDYVIGITMLGNYQKNDAVVQSIATNFNIDNIYLKNSSYVIDNNKLIYSSDGSNQYLFHKEIGSYTDLVVQNGQRLSINRKNYIKTKNGINMVIYDKFTEEIVDNIYLEYKGKTINPTIKR